jgi:short-subunit dehydrogenase
MLNPKLPQNFKNVLITGASQGIGRALAESFAKRGANLLLVSRSEGRLREVAQALEKKYPHIRAQVCAMDLAKSDSAKKLKSFCEDNNFAVDTLVNNAGYGVWGKFSELSLQEQLDCLQVNSTSLVQLTYEFLPLLKANAKPGQARILNVSSMTAYQAIPTFAIYAASKAFVLSFSRAIHHELKPEGVVVTALVPGTTESGFIDRAGIKHTEDKAKKVMMTAEVVAEVGVRALEAGKIEVIPGGLNILMAGVTRLLSKNILETAAQSIYRKQ